MDATDCAPRRRLWFSRFIFLSSSGDRSWEEDICVACFQRVPKINAARTAWCRGSIEASDGPPEGLARHRH